MDSLIQISSNPLLLSLLLIAVSWIWEDAAVIAGALLAVDENMSILLALSAVFIGITTGDLALYYLGRYAHRWRGLRGWIMLKPQSRYMSRRFHNKTLFNILMVRFIPGLRTLGFMLCGMWKISASRFIYAMTFAGVIWVGFVFTSVYKLGSAELFENSHWKWSLMLIALFMLVFNNLWSYYRSNKR